MLDESGCEKGPGCEPMRRCAVEWKAEPGETRKPADLAKGGLCGSMVAGLKHRSTPVLRTNAMASGFAACATFSLCQLGMFSTTPSRLRYT